MKQYLEALKKVNDFGKFKKGPQKNGTMAYCGIEMRFNMARGFPLITTRSLKGSFRAAVSELLWILSGSNDVRVLQKKYGVHFWDDWVEPCFKANEELGFKLPKGVLGPSYGHQMRNWGATRNPDGTFQMNGRDQIDALIKSINKYPGYRRHVISLYNPADFNTQDGEELIWICTCHGSFVQFLCYEDEDGNKFMDMCSVQRSGDMVIGVPFDIAEYALLFLLVSHVTGYRANRMSYFISDAHIYERHLDRENESGKSIVDILLSRKPMELPQVVIPDISDLSIQTVKRLRPEDFRLVGYESHPAIKDIPVEV